ncbi:MAG TPA: hypothetical protein VE622_01615 [Nitrososphaeraceae archaeon]|nr:hypothetical protein [Nitrososphaeraceae archaeon]
MLLLLLIMGSIGNNINIRRIEEGQTEILHNSSDAGQVNALNSGFHLAFI